MVTEKTTFFLNIRIIPKIFSENNYNSFKPARKNERILYPVVCPDVRKLGRR